MLVVSSDGPVLLTLVGIRESFMMGSKGIVISPSLRLRSNSDVGPVLSGQTLLVQSGLGSLCEPIVIFADTNRTRALPLAFAEVAPTCNPLWSSTSTENEEDGESMCAPMVQARDKPSLKQRGRMRGAPSYLFPSFFVTHLIGNVFLAFFCARGELLVGWWLPRGV